MMFLWKPDMIRFMRDACEYSGYNAALAKVMLPYLTEDSHVCDAGCGLGYLSLELAGHVGRVTAVDINADALNVLRENIERRGIANIDAVCGDVFSLSQEEKYSAMVFCYFGDIETVAERADGMCSGPVFVFKRNYEMHRFSSGSIRSGTDSYEYCCGRLDAMGLRYSTLELEAEFGQPFKSVDDAKRFYEIYSRDGDKHVITNLLLMDRLVYTGREDFPLYMPYMKKTGCIIINPQDRPADNKNQGERNERNT